MSNRQNDRNIKSPFLSGGRITAGQQELLLGSCDSLSWWRRLNCRWGSLICGFSLVSAQVIVIDKTPPLDALGSEIRNVASEQQEITGLHLPSESHEH